MRIYIPTYGRPADKQYTYRELGPLVDKYHATLVASPAEAKALNAAGLRAVPCKAQGDIGKVRQWILDNAEDDLILMMDDDLSSWCARRQKEEKVRYTLASVKEREYHFTKFEKLMSKFSHGAFGHRLFANERDEVETNTRLLRALAYRPSVLKKAGVHFRMSLMEDLDVQLQLMKLGHDAVQYNGITHEQPGSNTAGGCSLYRTAARQEQAAEELRAYHPDCVTVVEKKLKVGWGGQVGATRADVRVSWRKAVQNTKLGAAPHARR